MQVDFYHLTVTPLFRALPTIAARVIADGGRLLIVTGSAEQGEELDRLLWTYATESFLPHGRAGGGNDGDQPILIASEPDAINAARFVALVDGEWRDAALAFDRAFHFFADERIAEARLAWRGLADRDGVERRYWKQDEAGRWSKAA